LGDVAAVRAMTTQFRNYAWMCSEAHALDADVV
jgi:hypothetical protein